jgi:hypothetical protein
MVGTSPVQGHGRSEAYFVGTHQKDVQTVPYPVSPKNHIIDPCLATLSLIQNPLRKLHKSSKMLQRF